MKITELLHKITQLGYTVAFNEDFEGMLRLDFTVELDETFYEHYHVGHPGATMEQLNAAIEKALSKFLGKHK